MLSFLDAPRNIRKKKFAIKNFAQCFFYIMTNVPLHSVFLYHAGCANSGFCCFCVCVCIGKIKEEKYKWSRPLFCRGCGRAMETNLFENRSSRSALFWRFCYFSFFLCSLFLPHLIYFFFLCSIFPFFFFSICLFFFLGTRCFSFGWGYVLFGSQQDEMFV